MSVMNCSQIQLELLKMESLQMGLHPLQKLAILCEFSWLHEIKFCTATIKYIDNIIVQILLWGISKQI